MSGYLKLSVQSGQLDLSQANGRKPAQSLYTKKENPNDPANFLPITLQSVLLKVLPRAFVMLFSTSLPLIITLNMKSKMVLYLVSQEPLSILLK